MISWPNVGLQESGGSCQIEPDSRFGNTVGQSPGSHSSSAHGIDIAKFFLALTDHQPDFVCKTKTEELAKEAAVLQSGNMALGLVMFNDRNPEKLALYIEGNEECDIPSISWSDYMNNNALFLSGGGFANKNPGNFCQGKFSRLYPLPSFNGDKMSRRKSSEKRIESIYRLGCTDSLRNKHADEHKGGNSQYICLEHSFDVGTLLVMESIESPAEMTLRLGLKLAES